MSSEYKTQVVYEKASNEQMYKLIEKTLKEKIYPATKKQDCSEGFDAISESGTKIAIRVRTYKYRNYFGKDFSIRYKTNDGGKTEWSKIFEDGLCDIMFYGLMNESNKVENFITIDLEACRLLYELGLLAYEIKQVGKDGNQAAFVKIDDFIKFKK